MKYLRIFFSGLAIIIGFHLNGQTYFTKEGEISIYSKTPLEEINAVNKKAVSVFSLDDAKIEFSVLIKGFFFENALMQTHFNENYMESNIFPKSEFKSTEVDLSSLNISEDGQYEVPVEGILKVKGKEKEIKSLVTFTIKAGDIMAETVFRVTPQDFNIEIPSVVRDKIAREVEVTVKANYQIYKKP